MQMFKDYYAQKESKIIHRHILLLDIQLWLRVASHFFKNYILKCIFNHKSLLLSVLWKMSSVKMCRWTYNSG